MARNTITRNEYHQLAGLLVLGQRAQQQMSEFTEAAREITGEDDRYGHTNDAMWEGYTVDGLLDRLNITVDDTDPEVEQEPPEPDPASRVSLRFTPFPTPSTYLPYEILVDGDPKVAGNLLIRRVKRFRDTGTPGFQIEGFFERIAERANLSFDEAVERFGPALLDGLEHALA